LAILQTTSHLARRDESLNSIDHPPTPATASHPPGPLFQTPSLPSLVPTSPSSSPSTERTSRYSSLNSSVSTTVSELPPQPPQGGWWAPDFERGERSSGDRGSSDRSSSSLPHPPPAQRGHSFPLGQLPWMDEHDNKRRRSDQPRSAYDAEEAARLRWQAQSRNASFPVSGSISAGSSVGLRGLLHPHSAASAAMSRGSVSASGGMTPISPNMETRRPSAAPRSASVVGGQLAQSFADLSARDRNSPMMEMPPPSLHGPPPDRRSSMFPSDDARSMPGPLPHMSMTPPPPQPMGESASMSAMSSATSRPPSTGPEPLRRGSLTRPPTPEPPRSVPRRSSLTEIIRAKSGDVDTLATLRSREAIVMDKSSLSEPGGLAPWPARRESAESIKSAPGISLNSDGEGGGAGGASSMRGRKRPSDDRPHLDQDVEMAGDPGMRGMEVLAESARRVAEEERKTVGSEDREGSPGKGPGPKYTCAYCAKTFSRPSSLRIHTYSRESFPSSPVMWHVRHVQVLNVRLKTRARDRSCARNHRADVDSRCNRTSSDTPRSTSSARKVMSADPRCIRWEVHRRLTRCRLILATRATRVIWANRVHRYDTDCRLLIQGSTHLLERGMDRRQRPTIRMIIRVGIRLRADRIWARLGIRTNKVHRGCTLGKTIRSCMVIRIHTIMGLAGGEGRARKIGARRNWTKRTSWTRTSRGRGVADGQHCVASALTWLSKLKPELS
jgi:hypothetical protein